MDQIVLFGVAVVGFILVVYIGLFVIVFIGQAIFDRPTAEERANEKIQDHYLQRSRKDAELRVQMRIDAEDVREQLRRELGER